MPRGKCRFVADQTQAPPSSRPSVQAPDKPGPPHRMPTMDHHGAHNGAHHGAYRGASPGTHVSHPSVHSVPHPRLTQCPYSIPHSVTQVSRSMFHSVPPSLRHLDAKLVPLRSPKYLGPPPPHSSVILSLYKLSLAPPWRSVTSILCHLGPPPPWPSANSEWSIERGT